MILDNNVNSNKAVCVSQYNSEEISFEQESNRNLATQCWYALHTRRHHENIVVNILKTREIETYLPIFASFILTAGRALVKVGLRGPGTSSGLLLRWERKRSPSASRNPVHFFASFISDRLCNPSELVCMEDSFAPFGRGGSSPFGVSSDYSALCQPAPGDIVLSFAVWRFPLDRGSWAAV